MTPLLPLFSRRDNSSNMLKRSFGFKDRAGKATKPIKRSFRDDAKLKLMEQLAHPSSPPSAVYVSCLLCLSSIPPLSP
jgi:hypothetical protein